MDLSRLMFLAVLLLASSVSAQTIDHTSIDAFGAISAQDKAEAAALRVLIIDQSVGGLIADDGMLASSSGLGCLAQAYASAPTACKRYLHPYGAPYNNVPEMWAGTWPRTNVAYMFWPDVPCGGLPKGTWTQRLACLSSYLSTQASEWDVLILMPAYSDGATEPIYASSLITWRSSYPLLNLPWVTSSLARAPMGLSAFNAAVRADAVTYGGGLFDVADIEQHDQSGVAWFDNRNGVPFGPSCFYADDGINEPAIAPHYTKECDGGHPGNPDVGKIRLAKAIWVYLAGL